MASVLVIFLALASAWDVALHRIPNPLAVGVAIAGLLEAAIRGGMTGLFSSALAVVCVLAVALPMWRLRFIGGGDLKLAAAAAGWVGLGVVPTYLLASAVAAGALAAGSYVLSARTARAEVRRNLVAVALGSPVHVTLGAGGGRVQVPAGAAFAIGALTTIAMAGRL